MVEATKIIPYRVSRHPDRVPVEVAMQTPHEGTNCQLLVGMLAKARGFEIPNARSKELMEDRDFTQLVPNLADAQTGDIVALTTLDENDTRRFHLGMLSKTDDGINITHNARDRGEAQTEELAKVMESPLYARLAWIKRPFISNPFVADHGFLRDHGFEHLI